MSRAIVVNQFGGPEVLHVQEVADPVADPGTVVVRTASIGVNPVETYIRAGKYGPKPFPYTPGTDAAGIVESIGPGVTAVKPGDRVYLFGADGSYAERVRVPAAQVRALPERMTFDQGAAVGVPYATAYRALFVRGGCRPHETVLIHGASGGVGLAAVQLAVAAGSVVIGTAGTPAGIELVTRQGAAKVFDHRDADHFKQILDWTAGRGVDVVVEMLADQNLDKDLGILAKRGRVVVVGNRGRVEIDARQMMAKDTATSAGCR